MNKPKIGDILNFENENVVITAIFGDILYQSESLKFGDTVSFYYGDFPVYEMNDTLHIWITPIATYPHSYFRF